MAGKTQMITGVVRVSYLNVWEPRKVDPEDPNSVAKYSVSILIPKSDKKTLKELESCCKAAVELGIDKGKFKKAQAGRLRFPMRDGDEEAKTGDRGDEYKGMIFINANSTRAPGVVGKDAKPLMDQDDIYSGAWCRVDINCFPYNTKGNLGIGVGFNNIMKVKDDERLDGRRSAESAFADYADDLPEGDGEGDGDLE